MRDILFKAKRLNNGEWVEGSLVQTTAVSLKSFIVPSCCYTFEMWDWKEVVQVDTDTICQYTGLTDKNGNKIWENDVVECKNDESHFQSQIEWDKSYCGFILQDSDTSSVGLDVITKGGIYKDVQVIGNVFDNLELLESRCEDDNH